MGKISEFFKNIIDRFRKKPKALPEAQEEEKIEETNPQAQKEEFLEEIKYDPLSPEECRGIHFYQNILRSLGVREEILNNPDFIEEFDYIISDYYFTRPELKRPDIRYPTAESIQQTIELIRSHAFYGDDDRKRIYATLASDLVYREDGEDKRRAEHTFTFGFGIDPNTGDIRIQRLHGRGRVSDHTHVDMEYQEHQYSVDEKGELTHSYSKSVVGKDKDDEYIEHPVEQKNAKYNKHGLNVYQRYTAYTIRKKDGQTTNARGVSVDSIEGTEVTLDCYTRSTEKNPLIFEFEVLDGEMEREDGGVIPKGSKSYFCIDEYSYGMSPLYAGRSSGSRFDTEAEAEKNFRENDEGFYNRKHNRSVMFFGYGRFHEEAFDSQILLLRDKAITETESEWRQSEQEIDSQKDK